jgi:flagellin-like hook-associated protein FlgL
MNANTFNTSFLQGKCGITITDGLADRIDGNDTTNSAAVPNSGGETPVSADTTTVTIGSTPVTVHWNQASTGGIVLQIGAEANNSMELSIEAVSAKSIGVDTVSVLSKQGAKEAIEDVESAIDKVSKIRSKLGAFQNRLEHTIANLDNVVENTQSAESAIRDTDMAAEMVSYSKTNILMQAGQAMIAQANQQPRGVLALLS